MTRDKRTYIKVHDGLPDHPKLGKLDDDQAAWLYVACMCYCSVYRTNGRIPKAKAHRLTKGASSARCEKLVKAGLLDDCDDEYAVHDYLEHQRSKEQIEAITTKRQEAGKRGGRPKANGNQNGLQAVSNDELNHKANGTQRTEEVPNGTSQTEVPKISSSGADAPSRHDPTAAVVVAAYVEASQDAGRGRPTGALVKKVGKDAKRLLEAERVPLERVVQAARHVGAGGWANLDVGLSQTVEVRRDLQEWIEP